MKQIIVTKKDTISPTDKETLKENGIILIECENPNEVRVINQIEGFEADDFVGALIHTVRNSMTSSVRDEFAKNFLDRTKKK